MVYTTIYEVNLLDFNLVNFDYFRNMPILQTGMLNCDYRKTDRDESGSRLLDRVLKGILKVILTLYRVTYYYCLN